MKPLYSPAIDGNYLPPWIFAALQTRQAQALVQGRTRQDSEDSGKPAIPGLAGFNFATAQIWKAAAAGDPYADLALLRLEAALAAARAGQRALRGDLGHLAYTMEPAPGAGAGVYPPAYPVRVQPPPANPYAHHGACLLADFDGLVLAILAARQQRGGIDRRQAYSSIFHAGRPVRRIFCLPCELWRHTGVTRQDIRRNTRLARQAEGIYAKLGIPGIPADILQGSRHAKHAPILRQPRPERKRIARPRWPGGRDGNRADQRESIR